MKCPHWISGSWATFERFMDAVKEDMRSADRRDARDRADDPLWPPLK